MVKHRSRLVPEPEVILPLQFFAMVRHDGTHKGGEYRLLAAVLKRGGPGGNTLTLSRSNTAPLLPPDLRSKRPATPSHHRVVSTILN